jgi:hypothetical protein
MKPSQMPEFPLAFSEWLVLFQPLKSPITVTATALGAKTTK